MANHTTKTNLAVMQDLFPDNTYYTPPETPRAFWDRFFFNSRVYFWVIYLTIVARAYLLVRRGQFDRAAFVSASYRVFQLAEACGGRFHITGLDHLRAPETAVIVANHTSSLEANVFPGIIGSLRPVSFVVKASLLDYPFLGDVVRAGDPIDVGRASPREDLETVLSEGAAKLEQGISVVMFPEATRVARFDAANFNSLGVKLARRAGVPVLPVAVKTDFIENGRFLRDFGRLHRDNPIHIAFGPPIPVIGRGHKAHQQSVDFISTHLQQWQEG